MRKITKNAVKALYTGVCFSAINTKVYGDKLFLHNNAIAKIENGELYISTAGWNTLTTRERLNGFPGISVYMKKGILFLNDKEWDGSWTRVDTMLFFD